MRNVTSSIFILLSLSTIYFPVQAESPSDEELLELEQQINLQEKQQEKEERALLEEERRKLEEEKLKEERALLEEERRKLEEEKQAELIRRQEEEDRAKRRLEEQQHAAAEAEIKKQFEQHMTNATTATNNHDYKSALQSYTQALEIVPNDSTAIEGQTKAKEYQEICLTLVGEWNWFLAKLVVHENGTMNAIALIPNQGKWECTNPAKREFVLHWEVGGWVDTLTMSPDGNRVDAINNIGMRFHGTRKGSEAEKSGPEIKL